MAAASPVAGSNNASTPQRSLADTPKQNLRGLNKPKCSKCGNVARSRCPYQSCKSCCAKAQNPCPIHVLKPNATFPDKPSSSLPLFDQQTKDVSSTGATPRVSSFRQLSSNLAAFNGVHAHRERRPLSRKDVAVINAWRFSKLKEYKDSYIEAENEAFERYMQNVALLEEAFFLDSSLEGLTPDGLPVSGASSLDKDTKLISSIKSRLKSNPERADKCRRRVRDLIEQGLDKLQKRKFDDEGGPVCDVVDSPDSQKELKRPKKEKKSRLQMISAMNDLLDKLNKVRSEEDLKTCKEMRLKLFNQQEVTDSATPAKPGCHKANGGTLSDPTITGDVSKIKQEPELARSYPLPRLCTALEVDQEILSDIDAKFSCVDEFAEL